MPEATVKNVAEAAGMYRDGKLDIELADRALTVAGRRAERKARSEITSNEYDDIVANKGGSKSEEYADLQEAEGLLAAYYAMPALNLRITKKGGAVRRTGLVDNENDLMSYSEMDAYRETWFGAAVDIFEEIAPESSTEQDPVYAL